jgi:hypothetical protein
MLGTHVVEVSVDEIQLLALVLQFSEGVCSQLTSPLCGLQDGTGGAQSCTVSQGGLVLIQECVLSQPVRTD